ncbi:hypothetical protein JNK13_05200 [bacterium]|nr:hypothetical protein [bacterium]
MNTLPSFLYLIALHAVRNPNDDIYYRGTLSAAIVIDCQALDNATENIVRDAFRGLDLGQAAINFLSGKQPTVVLIALLKKQGARPQSAEKFARLLLDLGMQLKETGFLVGFVEGPISTDRVSFRLFNPLPENQSGVWSVAVGLPKQKQGGGTTSRKRDAVKA